MFLNNILAIILILNVSAVVGQTEWELTKDKNGIKVYTAKDNSSKFKSIKVEAQLTGTLQQLVNILSDVNNTKNWVYSTKESYAIRRFSPTEVIYYNETALPWPVDNRDAAIRMKMSPDFRNNTMKVFATGVPQAIPEKKGIVRIQHLKSSWDVRFDGQNKLFITYLLTMDPGGTVSPAITNMFITKGPFETFSNLANKLK